MTRRFILLIPPAAVAALAAGVSASPVVRSAAGADPASIQAAVDQFRIDISLGGANNGVGGGPFATGRREINWDAAGLDAFASPGLMPADFFNRAVAGSPRGAEFTSPGAGVQVSQRNAPDPGDPNLRFGNISPQYNTIFQAFSQQRLFAGAGSTVIDGRFFVPSSPTTAATVFGFGAVFTDVDLDNSTFIDFFDEGGQLLHRAFAAPANNGLSFLGVSFDAGERVASIRMTLGNTAMAPGVTDGFNDVNFQDIVAADDFFYSEPQAVPGAPAAGLLALAAGAGLRRRRR